MRKSFSIATVALLSLVFTAASVQAVTLDGAIGAGEYAETLSVTGTSHTPASSFEAYATATTDTLYVGYRIKEYINILSESVGSPNNHLPEGERSLFSGLSFGVGLDGQAPSWSFSVEDWAATDASGSWVRNGVTHGYADDDLAKAKVNGGASGMPASGVAGYASARGIDGLFTIIEMEFSTDLLESAFDTTYPGLAPNSITAGTVLALGGHFHSHYCFGEHGWVPANLGDTITVAGASAPVPEPGTLSLLALGLVAGGLVLSRRKR